MATPTVSTGDNVSAYGAKDASGVVRADALSRSEEALAIFTTRSPDAHACISACSSLSRLLEVKALEKVDKPFVIVVCGLLSKYAKHPPVLIAAAQLLRLCAADPVARHVILKSDGVLLFVAMCEDCTDGLLLSAGCALIYELVKLSTTDEEAQTRLGRMKCPAALRGALRKRPNTSAAVICAAQALALMCAWRGQAGLTDQYVVAHILGHFHDHQSLGSGVAVALLQLVMSIGLPEILTGRAGSALIPTLVSTLRDNLEHPELCRVWGQAIVLLMAGATAFDRDSTAPEQLLLLEFDDQVALTPVHDALGLHLHREDVVESLIQALARLVLVDETLHLLRIAYTLDHEVEAVRVYPDNPNICAAFCAIAHHCVRSGETYYDELYTGIDTARILLQIVGDHMEDARVCQAAMQTLGDVRQAGIYYSGGVHVIQEVMTLHASDTRLFECCRDLLHLLPGVNEGFGFDREPSQVRLDRLLLASLEQSACGVMERAIRNGANINIADADVGTSLMWAASHSSPYVVRRLLQAGADVSVRTARATVMSAAVASIQWVTHASYDATACICVLLASGANMYGKATGPLAGIAPWDCEASDSDGSDHDE